MKPAALRAAGLGCALLATIALTAPAPAQTAPPPRFQEIDDNGVDLVSGRFVFSMVEGSIGSGDGAVRLIRSERNDYGRLDGWSGTLFQRAVDGGSEIVAQFAGRSDTFTISGGTYTATKANGATLAGSGGNLVYTAGDGTTTTFGVPVSEYGSPIMGPGCSEAVPYSCMLPMTVARPNGTTFTLGWTVVERCFQYDQELNCVSSGLFMRLGGVTSSTGYGFTLSYASNLPGTGAPIANWYRRTGASFTNSVSAPPATPTVTYTAVSTGVEDVTDTGGRTWRITSSSSGITGVRRPGSSSDDISISYGSGGVVSAVTRDGVTTGYARSVSGTIATTTVTNALSEQTVVVADLVKERIISITDPLSRQTGFEYDGNSRMTLATQPEGNNVAYTYDARGNVTEVRAREKDDDEDGEDDIVTAASYDSSCSNPATCNQPNSVTDARGYTTDYTYDATHGGLLTVTAPAPSGSGDRPQTRHSYTQTNGEYRLTGISACSAGTSPGCVGGANEARTVIGYDSQGQVNSIEQRDGSNSISAVSAMTYDAYGNLATIDGPLSGTADTVRFRYNAARQVIGEIGPDPDEGGTLKHRALRATYRSDGLPTNVERGTVNSQSDSDWTNFATLEEVQTDYDSNDRPTVRRIASASTTHALSQTSYDGLGRVQCVAQRMNPSEFSSLPSDACTLDNEGSFGPDRIVRTTYDDAGQVTLVQTGYGVTGVAADEMTAAYTDNGQVETLTDAEGNRTTYVYDGHDRLSRTRMPSPTTDGASSTTDYEELSYDPAGNVLTRRLRDGQTIAFTYDDLNRLIERDIPAGAYGESDIAYAYDNFGRLTSATSANSHVVSRGYDALGRVTSETGPMGTKTMAWDLAGRMTRLTWPDGFQVGYSWLVTGEMLEIREAPGGGNVLLATLVYDDLGRRTRLSRGNGAVTAYDYDAVSRLTELTQNLNGTSSDLSLGFAYNPASQIIENMRSNDAFAFTGHANVNRTDTVNGLNQVATSGGATMAYDGRGNLANDGSRGYLYTSENRLAAASPAIQIAYDPAGRIFQFYNYDGTTEHYTRFDHLGGTIVSELNLNTGTMRRYVPGPDIDEPILWYEGSGTSDRRWFHADERGSIVAVSDGSGNLVGARNRYDEYGNVQGTLTGRFGFTGQLWMPELGLSHYRARAYNPSLGRFMQEDPIGYEGGMNLYAYVLNDPVNLVDPSGLEDEDEGEGPITVCGRPSRNPWNECYDPAYASFLEGLSRPGRTLRWGARQVGGGRRPSVNEMVDRARCAIGRAGIHFESAGSRVAETGTQIAIAGALTAIGGAILGNPVVVSVGIPIVGIGATTAGVGGIVAVGGAGMRAIGGDYQNFMSRALVQYLGGRAPGIPAGRRAVTGETNQQITNPRNSIPTCR